MSRLFSADGHVVTVLPAAEINNLAQRTICIWAKLTSGADVGFQGLAARVGSSLFGLEFDGANLQYPFATVAASTSNADTLGNDYLVPPAGVWTHLALTYNNSGDRKVHVYENGIEINYYQQDAAVGTMTDDSAFNLIVGNGLGGTREFRGRLFDFRLYDSILTPTELLAIIAGGPTVDPQPASNKCQLTFWTDQGSTEPDISSNGNTGVITGAAYSSDNPLMQASLMIRLPGDVEFTDYSDYLVIASRGGGGGTFGVGGQVSGVASVVQDCTCAKVHELNQIPRLGFSLGPELGLVEDFVRPPRWSEVRLDTLEYPELFTGFIVDTPQAEIFGVSSADGEPIIAFNYVAVGEEVLLNMNLIGVIPPFVGKMDGDIIAALIHKLAPGRFDTTDLEGFGYMNTIFTPQPQERFSDVVSRLLGNQSVKMWFRRGVVFIDRYDDGALYIADEENDPLMDPYDLAISPVPSALRNDVTGFGAVERKAYAREYFVADGITANWPIKLPVFGVFGNPLFSDDFSGESIDLAHWIVEDLTGTFVMFDGSLNIVGGDGLDVTKLLLNQGLEMKGNHRLNGGEFRFVGPQDGIVCGLYLSTTLTKDQCQFGFQLSPIGGQTEIQPLVAGLEAGDSMVTEDGKSYSFHIYIDAQCGTRSWKPWWSRKNPFGGGERFSKFLVTFIVEENDELQVKNPVLHQLHQIELDTLSQVFLYIGAASVNSMDCAVNFFSVSEPIQAALLEETPVGSPPILTRRRGTLGFVGESDADATIAVSRESFVLAFFQETRLEAKAKFELRYRSAGVSVARVIDQGSIDEQAAAFGDSGIRSDVIVNASPQPQSSEEVEAMLQAFLEDSIEPDFSGAWAFTVPPYGSPAEVLGGAFDAGGFDPESFDTVGTFGSSAGIVGEPIPGRFIRVISPRRLGAAIGQFDGLVKVVETDIIATEKSGACHFVHKLDFGQLITRRMDTQLQRFIRATPPPEVLAYNPTASVQAVDTSLIATQFIEDLADVEFIGTGVAGSPESDVFNFDAGRNLIGDQQVEVRWSDAGWGREGGNNLIGRFSSRYFSIDRLRRDQWIFVKLCTVIASPPFRICSRRPAFLRVAYPLKPNPPLGMTVTNDAQLNFIVTVQLPTDARDVWGIEIRDDDDLTVLYKPEDILLSLAKENDPILRYTWPNPAPPSKVFTKTFYAYTFNLLGEYSSRVQVDAEIDAPSGMKYTLDPQLPLHATDAGSSITGTVDNERVSIESIGDVLYTFNPVTGLAYATKYHVYVNDLHLRGGLVTPIWSENPQDSVDNAATGRIYFGSIVTPAAGSIDTGGDTGGGSGGASGGIATYEIASQSLNDPFVYITSRGFAVDGDPNTKAVFRINSPVTGLKQGYLQLTGSDSALTNPGAVLKILLDFPQDDLNHGVNGQDFIVNAGDAIDEDSGGHISNLGNVAAWGPASAPVERTLYTLPLRVGAPMTSISVTAIIQVPSGLTDSSGAVEAGFYRAWVENPE